MQPQTFVFFGIVGSGKGTQVKLLMEFLKKKDGREQLYVGTGEIFRKILESGSEDASGLKELVHSGKLISDEITNNLVEKKVNSELTPEKHLIFDGYPRTLGQSKYFEELLASKKREGVKIIYIELSEAEATKRNLLRGRHDDTEEGLKKRFDEYKNNVIPAMSYFQGKNGYEIYTINGEQSVEDVHKEIINKIWKQ